MKLSTKLTIGIAICSFTIPAFAWSNHAGITYIILQDHWKGKIPASAKAESLEQFILKEKNTLAPIINDIDTWAAQRLPHCPEPPESIRFSPEKLSNKADILPTFFRSIRVNPKHQPTLYVQDVTRIPKTPYAGLDQITTLKAKDKLTGETFRSISVGNAISPIDIISTAVDEPDYDLDFHLFTSSEGEEGKIYGFGDQAFGNPKLEYSSQAPFHMGFYHEGGFIFTLAGFLKRTYPEFRIYQYSKLSEHAFKTGHPYWGYRFAGWALHYIQDLTQPYHSSTLPRVGGGKMVGAQILATVGLDSMKKNMIEDVTSRHGLIEEYQYFLVRELIMTKNTNHIVAKALRTPIGEASTWIDFDSIREVITKEAYEAATEADEELENLELVDYEKLYEESHPIHSVLAKLLTNTSVHTRGFLTAILKPQ